MEWLFESIDLYCERTSPGLFAEPLNLFSNISFVLAGIWGLRYKRNASNLFSGTLSRNEFGSLCYLAIVVGIGSSLFHSIATRWAQLADVIPIGIFLVIFLWTTLKKGFNLNTRDSALGILGFIIVSGLFSAVVPKSFANGSQSYFGTWFTLSVLSKFAKLKSLSFSPNLAAATALFFAALVFRSIDMNICSDFAYGSHFMWHGLNGVVIYQCLKASTKF